MKNLKFLLGMTTVIFISCNVPNADLSPMENAVELGQASNISIETPNQELTKKNTLEHLKIIKSSDCRFQVNDLDSATSRSQEIIKNLGGYIGDMEYVHNDYQKENSIQLKVPSQNFDTALSQLSDLAVFIDFKNINSQDITARFIDVNARLATKLEVKKKYEDILRKKAKTVEELLETEDRLRVLQEEIEVAQAQVRSMNNQVSLSSIKITFYETVNYREEPEEYQITFLDQARNNLESGWTIITSLLLIAIYIWPLLIIIPLLWLFFRKKLKKKVKNS